MKTKKQILGAYVGTISYLKGCRLRVIRQSRATQGLTCEVQEDCAPYKQGDTINIAPYEFKRESP